LFRHIFWQFRVDDSGRNARRKVGYLGICGRFATALPERDLASVFLAPNADVNIKWNISRLPTFLLQHELHQCDRDQVYTDI
jgi:hypothetical protein